MFAARDDEAAQVARVAADELGELLPDVTDATPLAGEGLGSPREIAYLVAAAAPEQLALLRKSGSQVASILAVLSEGVGELDFELRERARDAGSLGLYDVRLRDELYESVLLTGISDDEELRGRALENLFRRSDLGDLRALMRWLPEDVLAVYVSRALTRTNRRGKRTDRTVFALELLHEGALVAPPGIDQDVRECLEDSHPALRLAAARVLAMRAR